MSRAANEPSLNTAKPIVQCFPKRIFGINRSCICLIILLLLASLPASALTVKDLYKAQVLVPSGADTTDFSAHARAGLLQVLVRVSGSTDVQSNPDVAAALDHPADYYTQYGYESTDRKLTVNGNEIPARILQFAFDPSSIARLLRQAGYAVWGSNRPAVMVWIAVNDKDGRRVLTDDDNSEVLQALTEEARLRGLPLLFPLLDLEDSSHVSTAEVWGLFLDNIDAASVRYNPDVILAGRIQQDGSGQWNGRWSYRIEDNWSGVDDTAFTVEDLVNRMVDKLADELARRYAVGSTRSNLVLKVEDVKTLQDYADVSKYLGALSPVVKLDVADVHGDVVTFRLATEGQGDQLQEIINLDPKLVLQNSGTGTEANPLYYRWMGK